MVLYVQTLVFFCSKKRIWVVQWWTRPPGANCQVYTALKERKAWFFYCSYVRFRWGEGSSRIPHGSVLRKLAFHRCLAMVSYTTRWRFMAVKRHHLWNVQIFDRYIR